DQRALAEIVQHQRGRDQIEPGAPDRRDAKWPMSAYSASVPVTASTTAPSARNAASGLPVRKEKAYDGSNAISTRGSCQIAAAPNAAIVANQTHISGPNSPPTFAVP